MGGYGKRKGGFTGCRGEFMEHYNLIEQVAINALPDANSIVTALSLKTRRNNNHWKRAKLCRKRTRLH
jgi:hypothetical protein